MRILLGAILLCSPLALAPVVATAALADSAILELRKTEVPSPEAAPATDPAPEAGAAERASRPVRRHRVAGSHYERERLRSSQTHG